MTYYDIRVELSHFANEPVYKCEFILDDIMPVEICRYLMAFEGPQDCEPTVFIVLCGGVQIIVGNLNGGNGYDFIVIIGDFSGFDIEGQDFQRGRLQFFVNHFEEITAGDLQVVIAPRGLYLGGLYVFKGDPTGPFYLFLED